MTIFRASAWRGRASRQGWPLDYRGVTRIDEMQSFNPPLSQEPLTSARFGTSAVTSNHSPLKP